MGLKVLKYLCQYCLPLFNRTFPQTGAVVVRNVFRTITADNGSEFSNLSEQGEGLQIDVYFCPPYASWEHGSNERHNGPIRRFIKKGQPIHSYTDEQIDDVENWMNTLPQKILEYQTPMEKF